MASSRPTSGNKMSVGKVGGVVRMLAERGLGTCSSSPERSSKDGPVSAPASMRSPLSPTCAASDYKPTLRQRLPVSVLDAAAPATVPALCSAVVSGLPDYATAVHSEQRAIPAQRCALVSRRFPSVRTPVARVRVARLAFCLIRGVTVCRRRRCPPIASGRILLYKNVRRLHIFSLFRLQNLCFSQLCARDWEAAFEAKQTTFAHLFMFQFCVPALVLCAKHVSSFALVFSVASQATVLSPQYTEGDVFFTHN